jgi:hypothetical protein
VASSEADARKGAYTNAFKKAAAFHGVGRQAYEGSLDDDNLPSDGVVANGQHPRPAQVKPGVAPPQPVVAQQPEPTPPGYIRTAQPVDTRATASVPNTSDRNRLSSKQLAAIWSIARKLGNEQSAFRSRVKAQYGCQLEFLSRQQASELITVLNDQLNGNGHAGELAS